MLTFSSLRTPLRGSTRIAATLAVALAALSAQADDLHPIVGGGLGAVAGAVIGQSVGGRQGAIIGAAVGGAAGVTLASQSGYHREPERGVVYQQQPRPAPVVGYRAVERVTYYRPHDFGRRNWGDNGHRHGHGNDKRYGHGRDFDDRRFEQRDDHRRGGNQGSDRGWDRHD